MTGDRGPRRRQAARLVAVGGAERGWTVVELLIVVALIGIVAGITSPLLTQMLHRAKIQKAIQDLRLIEFSLKKFETEEERLPDSLDELGMILPVDPWGHAYEYLVFRGPGWRGKARKDRHLVPINSSFDLYSIGPDAETRPPLQNKKSWDDIVRANDGAFLGLGRDF